jgi:hypothetical protein
MMVNLSDQKMREKKLGIKNEILANLGMLFIWR